VYQFRGMTD